MQARLLGVKVMSNLQAMLIDLKCSKKYGILFRYLFDFSLHFEFVIASVRYCDAKCATM